MRRVAILSCLALLIFCGQAALPAIHEPSADQIQAFMAAVEERREGVENWEQVQPLAALHNISDQMSLESWSRVVNVAAKSGLKSRMALLVHPLLKQRPYFDQIVHILGYDSDLLTRYYVFVNMCKLSPADPRTPKFGFLLLLDAWNGKWPDGIDMRGNSPREQIQTTILGRWQGPKVTMNTQIAGTFGLEGVTPERCAQLLSQSDKWVFDQSDQRWKVK